MKRWMIPVLFSVLLCYPAVSDASDDITHSGQTLLLNYPLMTIPFGAGPDSKAGSEKKAEGQHKYDEETEKKMMDKKVDDAIKKAWEEK